MARISAVCGGGNVRRLLGRNNLFHRRCSLPSPSSNTSSLLNEALILSGTKFLSFSPSPRCILRGLFSGFTPSLFSQLFLQNRMLSSSTSSSSPSSDPSDFVALNSEEELTKALSRTQDECLPAIFYFTAAWCGPCRFIAPTVAELSKKYPHVTVYKVDIVQEGLEKSLSELNINSVPTFHFYHEGKKVSEVLVADANLIKDTMEQYYKLN